MGNLLSAMRQLIMLKAASEINRLPGEQILIIHLFFIITGGALFASLCAQNSIIISIYIYIFACHFGHFHRWIMNGLHLTTTKLNRRTKNIYNGPFSSELKGITKTAKWSLRKNIL